MIRSRRTHPQPSVPVRGSNRLASLESGSQENRNGELESQKDGIGRSEISNEIRRRDAEPVEGSSMVEWLNFIVPYLRLSVDASEEEVRACLADGTVLCRILNKLYPGFELGGSSDPAFANVKRFLAAVEKLGFPTFELIDLEQGSLVPVMRCLSALKATWVLLRIQNKKYQSKLKVLETLALETGEVFEDLRGQLKRLECLLTESKNSEKELESKLTETVAENQKLYNEIQDLKARKYKSIIQHGTYNGIHINNSTWRASKK